MALYLKEIIHIYMKMYCRFYTTITFAFTDNLREVTIHEEIFFFCLGVYSVYSCFSSDVFDNHVQYYF